MEYVNSGRMFGKVRESKTGKSYISVLLTIKDVELFVKGLKETEYGFQVNGALFQDEKDNDKFSGTFSFKAEDPEPEDDPNTVADEPGPVILESKPPKKRKLF